MHVAIVTGAAGAIGQAIVERLSKEPELVVLAADADLRRARESLSHYDGDRVMPIELDVTDRDHWESAIEAVRDLGRLRFVVNNAGILRDSTLVKMTDTAWSDVISVHLAGAFLGCQHALREMKATGEGGSIVSMSSTAMLGSFGQASYSAAKSGIVGLTRTVAMEGARYGIRANAVAPGGVDSPMMDSVPQQHRDALVAEIPMARLAEPSEIAHTVGFLLSDQASYITGQTIIADGGLTLGG